MIQIILPVTGAGTWPRPTDWNDSSNTIELLGAGGAGGAGGGYSAAGAGGGEWSKWTNVSLPSTVSYFVGIGGGATGSNGGTPGSPANCDTWFVDPDTMFSQGGGNGGGASFSGGGGQYSTGIGDPAVRNFGGNGGAGTGSDSPGGGGGAGGPDGSGGFGGDPNGGLLYCPAGAGGGANGGTQPPEGTVNGDGVVGGQNRFGVGGGAGGVFNGSFPGTGDGTDGTDGGGGGSGAGCSTSDSISGNGGAGSTDIVWGGSYGPGGGGGAGGHAKFTTADPYGMGGAGGQYGGGGGGGYEGTSSGGAGGQGLIVITYDPVVALSKGVVYSRLTYVLTPVNPPENTPPVNTSAPTINRAVVGLISTCLPGTWTGTTPISFNYQWTVDGVNVGTNSSTYTVVIGDSGKSLICTVTAQNIVDTVSVNSNSITVTQVNPTNTVLPAIDQAVIGSVSGVTAGTWSGTPTITFSYQWKVAGSNVGTNANTYTPVMGDDTKALTCVVTAHNGAGDTDAISNSLTVTSSGAAPVNTVAPVITGATVGSVSTCSTGTWTGTPTITYNYQWKIDGSVVATNPNTYTPVSGDVGKTLTCLVTATNGIGGTNQVSNSLTVVAAGASIDIPDTASYAAAKASWPSTGNLTWRMTGSNYGPTGEFGLDFSSAPVVVDGLDITKDVFEYMEISSVKGITYRNFNVYGGNPGASGTAIQVHDGSVNNIIFQNVTCNSHVTQGTQLNSGWQFRNISNSTIIIDGQNDASKPDIFGRENAMSFIDVDLTSSITVTGITVDNNGVDGIIGSGACNITIDGALVKNQYYGPGDHPDAIQFFSSFDTGNPSTNVTIRNCGVDQGSFGDGMQGLFFENMVNLTLQDNWIYSGVFNNAISNSAGTTTLIDNNFAQAIGASGGDIITRGGSVNTTASNNTASFVTNYSVDGVNPGYNPSTLPGTNIIIPAASSYGDYSRLDPWLASHTSARRRT